MGDAVSGPDFFISYASVNRAWAEWIATQLELAGLSTVYQAADFRPGRDFVHEMQKAVSSARRTIAVLSPAYLNSQFGEAEWRVAFARDPSGEKGLLIPVRVQPCDPPGLLRTRVYVDLVDVDAVGARKRLLAAVDPDRPRPRTATFPGSTGPVGDRPGALPFPGAGPAVGNLPRRNPVFTGREEVIRAVYDGLRADASAAVVSGAVHGLGGVGKSAVAVEFAYRFASDYEVMWWIAAEQPATVPAQLARLGLKLGLPAADEQDAVEALFDHLRGRDRWLLIYDNAEEPDSLVNLLPPIGRGHVLVTSRWPDWRRRARPVVALDVWSRRESVRFLRARTRHTDETVLGELADIVGDLPLALEEAAAYLEQTGQDPATYVGLLRDRARELFSLGGRGSDAQEIDRQRVATVWTLSLERVHTEQPLAEQLLNLLAFLAPQVPRELPTEQPQLLPKALGTAVADPLAYDRLLHAVGRYSLVTLAPSGMGTHRLVQAVVQARLGRRSEMRWATVAIDLIRAVFPSDSDDVRYGPRCQELLPQLLVVVEHAERLGICGAQAGWLLHRAAAYLRRQGQFQRAERVARRALEITESALGADHTETAWRRDEIGTILQALGRLEEARQQYEQALAVSLAALQPDHPEIGTRRNSLGTALWALGRLDEARDQFEQALEVSLAALGPGHPDTAALRSNLGNALRDLGRLDDARDQLEQALEVSLAVLGPGHPDIGTRRNSLGMVFHRMGRLDEARDQFEQALTISVAALGPDHPDIGVRRNNLGHLLHDMGRLDAASDQFEQALTIGLTALGPNHPSVGVMRNNLGKVLWDLDRFDDARDQFEQALTISVAALDPNHPTIGLLRNNLGRVFQQMGRFDDARDQFEQALTISLTALGPEHPQTVSIRDGLTQLTSTPSGGGSDSGTTGEDPSE